MQSVPKLPQPVVAASDAGQLVTDLAATKAENARLQSELEAARQRIALLEGSVDDGSSAQNALRMELDSATARVGVLSGLVALYERLDEVDVGAFVANGFDEMGAAIGNVVDDIPTLRESLDGGRRLLGELEDQVPLVENARLWLLAQIGRIELIYGTIVVMLQVAAERSGNAIELMAEWLQKVLGWLPFGLGERTTNLINAVTALIDVMPETLRGTNDNVAQALELWLGKADESDVPLVSRVIVPLREQVLDWAEAQLSKTAELRQTYDSKITEPLRLAHENRQRIRDGIEMYRQQYEL